MRAELKPCPFCGGKAAVVESSPVYLAYRVRCKRCGAETGMYTTAIQAVRCWTDRAERMCRIKTRDIDGIEEDFCTACGNEVACYYLPHYCPNCGAKVVEE